MGAEKNGKGDWITQILLKNFGKRANRKKGGKEGKEGNATLECGFGADQIWS